MPLSYDSFYVHFVCLYCTYIGEQDGPGNNYPFRGGKYTDFEGGVRQAAFASGGLIPMSVRGTLSAQLIHIADMWATFSVLAGADAMDHKAASMGGVPPVDSLDVSDVFFVHNGTSPRHVIVLSSTAVTQGAFKLLHESGGGKNKWVPPEWPAYNTNGSSTPATPGPACNPCLFNVVNDPREQTNLATLPQYADMVANLPSLLNEVVPYQTGDDGYEGPYTNCTTVDAYKAEHADFLGPLCYKCTSTPCPTPAPSPPAPPSPTHGMLLRAPAIGLCVQYNGDKVGVSLTSCDGTRSDQQWYRHSNDGTVGSVKDGSKMCLRPTNPPMVPKSCVQGHGVMVGLNACLVLTDAGQLNASNGCAGMCAVPSNDHESVALTECATVSSLPVWELTNASLFGWHTL